VKANLLLTLEIVLWLGLYIVIALITILITSHIAFFLMGGRPTGSFGDMAIGMGAIYCGCPVGVVLALPLTYLVYIHSFGRFFEKFDAENNQK
jgi:hypothetical protein